MPSDERKSTRFIYFLSITTSASFCTPCYRVLFNICAGLLPQLQLLIRHKINTINGCLCLAFRFIVGKDGSPSIYPFLNSLLFLRKEPKTAVDRDKSADYLLFYT
ncbi:hypothetical protein VCUG_00222 [Vavraia culicis subsp. floridensis]|uniref:Uncharacterized protein n=1 Tax=Vavraia culicis (isolate floridensis) TaxID=948595 RepID=L2GXK3_VAVCU|nr:uncharacterized protein VCUG_00222 [Vavraia culicis subsp. floridensis]ELA48386.1 hypothetical protein VCUG_00222 [Vavraia culicis subsp. floridensis]